MNSVTCTLASCDHNTGFDNTCMYGVTKDLIESAKKGEPMCDLLRIKVLALVDEDKGI